MCISIPMTFAFIGITLGAPIYERLSERARARTARFRELRPMVAEILENLYQGIRDQPHRGQSETPVAHRT